MSCCVKRGQFLWDFMWEWTAHLFPMHFGTKTKLFDIVSCVCEYYDSLSLSLSMSHLSILRRRQLTPAIRAGDLGCPGKWLIFPKIPVLLDAQYVWNMSESHFSMGMFSWDSKIFQQYFQHINQYQLDSNLDIFGSLCARKIIPGVLQAMPCCNWAGRFSSSAGWPIFRRSWISLMRVFPMA